MRAGKAVPLRFDNVALQHWGIVGRVVTEPRAWKHGRTLFGRMILREDENTLAMEMPLKPISF